MQDITKIRLTSCFLWIVAVLSFIWWPLGHWLYPAQYHAILGFTSYELPFVRVIGTLSIMPVLVMAFAAINPLRNRDIIILLVISNSDILHKTMTKSTSIMKFIRNTREGTK